MHRIIIIALPGTIMFDLVIPLEIFGRAQKANGKPCYEVIICGLSKLVRGESLQFRAANDLSVLATADTIIVPGLNDLNFKVPRRLNTALNQAYKRGIRIASICAGSFILAEVGLLKNQSAATHWLGAAELRRRYPEVKVNADVLYVDSGQILTSAGACAGIDLCLHMIRKDFGAVVAAHSARMAVCPLERSGGQAQFISHKTPELNGGSLEKLLPWIEKNLHRDLNLEMIANQANMSMRTLSRQFGNQIGCSPLKWVIQSRVKRARTMLENSDNSIDSIAFSVGFNSAITMRQHFRHQLKTSPQKYREGFRNSA